MQPQSAHVVVVVVAVVLAQGMVPEGGGGAPMFSALFDMRYDHHPPILLSLIDPTRADRLAMTAPLDRRGWTA